MSLPEDAEKQTAFSLSQLTKQLTKRLEEFEKDKRVSSSVSMEPCRSPQEATTASSSNKFVEEFDIALSPSSHSTTTASSSSCDTSSVKTDSVPSISNPLSPTDWHSSSSSPPSAKSDVRSAQELIENLTALFACTQGVIKNDINLFQAHSKTENQTGFSLLQQPDANIDENVTRSGSQSVEPTKCTTDNSEKVTELASYSSKQGTTHHFSDHTPSTISLTQHQSKECNKNSPRNETNAVPPNSSSSGQSPSSVVFSEIIQESDIGLHQMAIEVDCSESHYLNLHDDSDHNAFIYQTATTTESSNKGISITQDTNSVERVGQVCSNQNDSFEDDMLNSKAGSQTEKGAIGFNGANGSERTNDIQTTSTVNTNTDDGRVLRKSCQRRPRQFFTPTEQTDSERTISASDDEDKDWVMINGSLQPARGRKRQSKGRRGSKSGGTLARKKSSKARQLVVKSKAVSLRKKQRQSTSNQLLKRGRGRPRKNQGSYESSDSSDGNSRRYLKERRPSRRSNASQLNPIDEDYVPTPPKRRKTMSAQSSFKNTSSMGVMLANILTDVPEVNMTTVPIPSLRTNTAESSTKTTTLNDKKHARPSSLKVDHHLPPQKRPKTKHKKSSSKGSVLPESISERIDESPTSKKQDNFPTKKSPYLGKVNMRLTSSQQSHKQSSNESTPINSPELGLQNKPLHIRQKNQLRPVIERISTSLDPPYLMKSKTTAPSDLSKHYRILMTWEKDYARGKKATKAPVLYAVEHMTDQIATTEGEWLEKAKLIWNQWRHRVDTEERQLYSERAKKNRKMLSTTLPSDFLHPSESDDGSPLKESHIQQDSHKDIVWVPDVNAKLSSENGLQSVSKQVEPNNVSDSHIHSIPSTSLPRTTAPIKSSSNKSTVSIGIGTHESHSVSKCSSSPDVQRSLASQTVSQQETVPAAILEKQKAIHKQLSRHHSPQTLSTLSQNTVSNTGLMHKSTSLTVSVPWIVSRASNISKTSSVLPTSNYNPDTPSTTHNVVAKSDVLSLTTTTSQVCESEADMKNRLSMLAYSLNSYIHVGGSPTTVTLDSTSQTEKKDGSLVPLIAKSPSPQRDIENKLNEFSFPITNLPTDLQLSSFLDRSTGPIPLQPLSSAVTTSFKFTSPSTTAVSLVRSSATHTHSVMSQSINQSSQVNVSNVRPSVTDLWSNATRSKSTLSAVVESGRQYPTNNLNTSNDTFVHHASQSLKPMKKADTAFCKSVPPPWNVNSAVPKSSTQTVKPPQHLPTVQNSDCKGPSKRKKGNRPSMKSLPAASRKHRKTSTKQGLSSYLERIPAEAPSFVIPEIPLSDISTNGGACKSSSLVPPPPLPVAQQKNQQTQQNISAHHSMQDSIDQSVKSNPFMSFLSDSAGTCTSPFGTQTLGGTAKTGSLPKSFYIAPGPSATTGTTTSPNNSHAAFHTNQTSFKLPKPQKKSPPNPNVSQSKTPTALPSISRWYNTKHTNSRSRSNSTSSSPITSPGTIVHSPIGFPPFVNNAMLKSQQNSAMHPSQVTNTNSLTPSLSTPGSWSMFTPGYSAPYIQSSTIPPKQKFESNNTQPKQPNSLGMKQDTKRRASLNLSASKVHPSSEKHHRLDVLKKVQQLNRDRQQQSTQTRQARSRSVGDEPTKSKVSSGDNALAATIPGTPTVSGGSIKEILNSISPNGTSQTIARPTFTPTTIHNERKPPPRPFWQPTSTEMARPSNQHSSSRRLSSEQTPNNGQSPPSERIITSVPNINQPSQSSNISSAALSTFSLSNVKVEQTSPVALVVGPPEPCSTLSSSITPPLTNSTTLSTNAIQPKNETNENSGVPQQLSSPSFSEDISTMSRWEIQQLYNYHKVQYEREKHILRSLKEKLIKMEKEEKRSASKKLSPDELYKRFLGFVVEPEYPQLCADSAYYDGFHFKTEANNSVSACDVLLGGTFEHPIINPKCDFYASFAK